MKDITIIIPVHKVNEMILNYLDKALLSVERNRENYNNKLITTIVCTNENDKNILLKRYQNHSFNIILNNSGKTDYCSQINIASKLIDTDYFSILEYDDEYTPKWFKMASEYYYTNEDVSLFLPINIHYEEEDHRICQFSNEIVWANEFSQELGYIDFNCLENYYGFNLTGGIFNTKDFIQIGGFKPSIKVSFNYEFLLRLTNKKLKAFVVPKEGYKHVINRKESLTDDYSKELTDEMINKWFDVAKCEYPYTEDRNVTPTINKEELK